MTTPIPPTPPPPPPLEPTPPTTVVTIPPEVLDRLTPHQSWWETYIGPVGTVATALIALIAAFFAWRGIQKQITADDKRATRTERLNLVSETLAATAVLQDAAVGLKNAGGFDTQNVKALSEFKEALLAANLAKDKLEANGGFGGVLPHVELYFSSIDRFIEGPPSPVTNIQNVHMHRAMLVSTFNKLLKYPEHWENAEQI